MDANVLDPVWDVLPLIISLMVLAVVFGAIGGLFSKPEVLRPGDLTKAKIISALALALVLSVCLAPGAMAASSSGTSVYLYDNGADAPNAETDWYAKVDQPLFILRTALPTWCWTSPW